jgi:outer membrane protein assembly factor BamB
MITSKLRLVQCACLLTLGVNYQPLQAADSAVYNRNWPQWRGPSGNGIVPEGNPPIEWSETKNIKWKIQIPGKGHATPVIWEDKIFLLTSEATGKGVQPPAQSALAPASGLERVFGQRRPRGGRDRRGGGNRGSAPTEELAFKTICLDRSSGKVLWEKVGRAEVPHQSVQRSNTYSSGSPVTNGEHVYASFGSHGLYCYDMNGNLAWQKDFGKFSVKFGEGASPALYGDTLIIIQDNRNSSFVTALNRKTGNEIWKKSRDEASGWTTPYLLNQGGRMQAVITGSNAVRGYDLATGDVLWECSGLGSNSVPSLVADQNTIYAMSGHNNGMAMAIQLGGAGDLTNSGAIRWKINRGTPYVPSPLLYDGLLYFCQRNDAILTCVDAASGNPHYSQERIEGISGVYASPIGVGNRIYISSQNGATAVIEKSKELKVIAINQLDDPIDASPAVVGNELFLRSHNFLYCIAE